MAERGRGRRGRTPAPTFWQKYGKWVRYGGIGAGALVALIVGGCIVLSLSSAPPDQPDQHRERLTAGGFGHELRDSSGKMTGTVWVPVKETNAKGADATIVYQDVTITTSFGKVKSVTSDAFSSADGRRSPKRQALCSLAFEAGGGVTVKETKPGAPQALVDRARKEFEQITTALSK
jgi:hypothetical protein